MRFFICGTACGRAPLVSRRRSRAYPGIFLALAALVLSMTLGHSPAGVAATSYPSQPWAALGSTFVRGETMDETCKQPLPAGSIYAGVGVYNCQGIYPGDGITREVSCSRR